MAVHPRPGSSTHSASWQAPAGNRFAVKGSLLPYHVGKAWFDFAGKTNEVRESVGRLAAFIYYRKQLTDGTLKTYGASKKPVVDAIRRNLGVDEAAAHLARNLFGDYRNLTELGDLARICLLH